VVSGKTKSKEGEKRRGNNDRPLARAQAKIRGLGKKLNKKKKSADGGVICVKITSSSDPVGKENVGTDLYNGNKKSGIKESAGSTNRKGGTCREEEVFQTLDFSVSFP